MCVHGRITIKLELVPILVPRSAIQVYMDNVFCLVLLWLTYRDCCVNIFVFNLGFVLESDLKHFVFPSHRRTSDIAGGFNCKNYQYNYKVVFSRVQKAKRRSQG